MGPGGMSLAEAQAAAKSQMEAMLAAQASTQGVPLEEFKRRATAQAEAQKMEMMKAMAAKHGMTVAEFEVFRESDEFKGMAAAMDAKYAAAAKAMGLTLNEYKAYLQQQQVMQFKMQMRMQQQQELLQQQQQQQQ
jgi:hypothetical protein